MQASTIHNECYWLINHFKSQETLVVQIFVELQTFHWSEFQDMFFLWSTILIYNSHVELLDQTHIKDCFQYISHWNGILLSIIGWMVDSYNTIICLSGSHLSSSKTALWPELHEFPINIQASTIHNECCWPINHFKSKETLMVQIFVELQTFHWSEFQDMFVFEVFHDQLFHLQLPWGTSWSNSYQGLLSVYLLNTLKSSILEEWSLL